MFAIEKWVTFFEPWKKKLIRKKEKKVMPTDLIFLAMLVETKNIFF